MIEPLLVDLHRRGVAFRLDGDRVHWRAPAGAIGEAELADLRAHRDRVLDLLDAYEERAAIMEYEAGMSREEAEAAAWREVVEGRLM